MVKFAKMLQAAVTNLCKAQGNYQYACKMTWVHH